MLALLSVLCPGLSAHGLLVVVVVVPRQLQPVDFHWTRHRLLMKMLPHLALVSQSLS